MIATMLLAATLQWPEVTQTMKPWAYNWWMGSAVDEKGLEYQCAEMEAKGFGGFHVIPIYGANGPDNCYRKQWKKLLSPEWIDAWNMAATKAEAHGLGIDLTMGSGWCFGGPWIPKELASSNRGAGGEERNQKVKRAGLGGEGYMLDPFSTEAMKVHVAQYEAAFGKNGTAKKPRAFYHDSYEYYAARPKEGQEINAAQLACFKVWTDWCRERGYLTRNEAHGAPCNWLDFYALADIPETEMFGRKDRNRDILLSKVSSSAAHVKGTVLASAETCTWVDEHFCEKPSDIKMMVDQLFLAGVNHVFYHGLCYSPLDAVWPGWTFYASLEMNPRNPLWREIGVFNAYVTRCQSIFQTWTPDNDVAIIFDPVADCTDKSVHNGEAWFYAQPMGALAKDLWKKGYQFDYISPQLLKEYGASRYKEVLDPKKGDRPVKAVPSPFAGTKGLMSTRWRKDGRVLYFVVNHTGKTQQLTATEAFELMDPMTGEISVTARVEMAPLQSLFVSPVDAASLIRHRGIAESAQDASGGVCLHGPWTVTACEGGPVLPAPKGIDRLAPWSEWDEDFSGTMAYQTVFDFPSPPPGSPSPRTLSLGDVREIARVRLNGQDLGCRLLPPYVFSLPPGALKRKGNVLEVDVTSLGANRIRWNDRTGVNWKYFTDINMVDYNYKKFDASKWKTVPSGLIGPVMIR